MKRNLFFGSCAILSAVMLWSAFPPLGETCAVVFALVPLMITARMANPVKSAVAWGVGGFLFWFATLNWMLAVSKNNGPLPLVILGWGALSAFCACYFALFGYLASIAWKKYGKWGIAFEPVLWCGLEWVRSWLFTGFAWNFLGTALAPIPGLASPAIIGGVYLVSALIVLLNGVIATIGCRVIAQMLPNIDDIRLERWDFGSTGKYRRILETAIPLAVILFAFFLVNLVPSAQEYSPLRVALVQRNAPCIFSRRDKSVDPYDVFDKLLDTAAIAKPDLIVWGESAMAEFGHLDSSNARHAALMFSRKTGGASLLAGGDWTHTEKLPNGTEEDRPWNAAVLYTPTDTGVELQAYGKQHLVPFGEYIPLDKWITPLQALSPVGISLHPGQATVFKLRRNIVADNKHGSSENDAQNFEHINVAPIICYEDTDPVLSRRAAKLGAQAIVLITNDSWFSNSHETVQHSWQAVLRAIETGLPVIRVGNSGVTGIIYPSGRRRWLEDGNGNPLVDAQGSMVESLPVAIKPVHTPYTDVGDIPIAGIFVISIALLIKRKQAKFHQ